MSESPRKVVHMPKVRMLRGGRPQSTIKITNVKSIKPPDPEILKKQEEESIRAEVQKEIESRSRTCAHRGYPCTQPVLGGRAYCARHALADPAAPYRQCAHVFGNGLRCTMLAPDDHREHRDQGLCFEHARIALAARQRSAAPPPPVTTAETLLNHLQHYIRPERTRTTSCASAVSVVSEPPEHDPPPPGDAVDPFKQIDATAVNASVSAGVMECASDTDSDRDSVALGEGGDCRGACDHDSEHEDAPAECSPLWNAGVFTAEEAVREARLSLRSLQAAYVQQMARLGVLLHSARAQYLKSLRAEREQYCSINTQAKSSPLTVRERQQLRKLKAYASYHRRHGVEAVLARKLHKKRAKVGDIGPQRGVPPMARCTFSEGGVRCDAAALPATRHCLRHILRDKHQVLFHACGDQRGGVPCREPVARLPLPSQLCRYHAGTPPYVYVNPKKESSEDVNNTESHSTTDDSQMEHMEDASTGQSSVVEEKLEIGPIPETDPLEENSVDTMPIDPLSFT